MTIVSKEKLEQIKLNPEENTKLNDFIGKAVRNNYTFKIMTQKVAVSPSAGIQELYNQNTETLVTYAGLLDKSIKGHTTDFNPLSTGNTAYMVGRVKGNDLLDILQLIIREKAYNEAVAAKVGTIKELEAQIESMKDPTEKRKDLEVKLAALQQ